MLDDIIEHINNRQLCEGKHANKNWVHSQTYWICKFGTKKRTYNIISVENQKLHAVHRENQTHHPPLSCGRLTTSKKRSFTGKEWHWYRLQYQIKTAGCNGRGQHKMKTTFKENNEKDVQTGFKDYEWHDFLYSWNSTRRENQCFWTKISFCCQWISYFHIKITSLNNTLNQSIGKTEIVDISQPKVRSIYEHTVPRVQSSWQNHTRCTSHEKQADTYM